MKMGHNKRSCGSFSWLHVSTEIQPSFKGPGLSMIQLIRYGLAVQITFVKIKFDLPAKLRNRLEKITCSAMAKIDDNMDHFVFGPNLEDYLTVYTASLVYSVPKRTKNIVKLVCNIDKSFMNSSIRLRIQPIQAEIQHRLPDFDLDLDYVFDH